MKLPLENTASIEPTGLGEFLAMEEAFARSVQADSTRVAEFYRVFAGKTARIRIVGQHLSNQLMPVFNHLKCGKGDIALQIDLWDARATDIRCPIDGHDSDPTKVAGEFGFVLGDSESRFIGCRRPHMLTWFDREANHMVGCVQNRRRLRLYEHGKPLHYLLLLWHGDRGVPVAHAGLVSRNGRGALFVGKSSSGKTTAALSCLRSGFHFLGDDYIGLQMIGSGGFVGHSLYNATWIWPDHLPQYPGLASHAAKENRWVGEKALVLLGRIYPDRLDSSARIQLILLPRMIKGGSTGVRVASKGEALFAVAPSSLVLLPSPGKSRLDLLAQLVNETPCYWLDIGTDRENIPRCVDELLER
jgi:hypothetical protein